MKETLPASNTTAAATAAHRRKGLNPAGFSLPLVRASTFSAKPCGASPLLSNSRRSRSNRLILFLLQVTRRLFPNQRGRALQMTPNRPDRHLQGPGDLVRVHVFAEAKYENRSGSLRKRRNQPSQ